MLNYVHGLEVCQILCVFLICCSAFGGRGCGFVTIYILYFFLFHIFVSCVLFGIYCFALHPEHLGQHAGI